ncbi:cobalamin B12-binding domain-containing protein [Parapusillimonas granuli]|uniref:Cobalamin B12-binding domain-containing protein n=1 Tax=Parapusillimonas granuli TaxID=380911 RepID=A0A853FWW3_9BURK|nr:cobalamin B12-binding domain-containing protein [Parapusillimonas granuli]MBB5214997.1 methylmalonyl-CoA mutase C-terminal domain/subunit [Parapusillimonas granuli]MEB2401149.1 cobalamin B12-binding domain-containing protein [Alcaligenaceae bacterium]NYT49318.1 cobalamin B12-binding domain-containing protein [Parapusillimonas granuli]
MAASERKVRVLVAKVGLDGHDVGARVIARGLLDAGMEVIYTGLRRTPEQVVRAALEEDVDVIGISILSGAHLTLLPRLRQLLSEAGAQDIGLIAGGVIPQEDIGPLKEAGVNEIFLSGTPVPEVVHYIKERYGDRT